MRRQERRADPLAHSTCDPQERQAAAHYISASGLEQVAQAMRGPEGARIGQAIWVSSRTEIGMRLQRLTGQDPEPTELRDPSALERACTETAERLSLAERRVSARLAEHLAIWRQLEVSGRDESRAPEQTARASACLRGIYLCAEGALLIGEREDDQRRWQAGNEAGIWIDRPWIDAAQDRAGGDRLGYGVPPRQAAENRRLQATEDALRAEWPAACLRAAALRLT